MCKVLAVVVAAFVSLGGCCHSMSVADYNISVRQKKDPNDFVRSTAMIQAHGTMIIDGKPMMVGLSASAVAINKQDLLTAAHFCSPIADGIKKGIIKDNIEIYVLNNNDEVVVMNGGKIVYFDEEKDVCMIRREGHGLIPASIALPSSIKRGDKVYIIGGPRGIFPIKTDGEVALPFINLKDETYGRTMVTAASAGGSSGGPCFNEQGQIIGLVQMGLPDFDHVAILTPAWMILQFLNIKIK